MPPNRKRGGSFGGSLLKVPTPLPDDDGVEEEPRVPEVTAESAPQAPAPVPEASPPVPATEAAEGRSGPDTAALDDAAAARPRRQRGSGGATAGGTGRERPPATIRLDERAAPQLWDAFVEAKQVDPFLSYRQFASGVVLDGLATHHRRQQRSS